MLGMEFEPQIRKIVHNIRDDRQTIMTSVTWNTETNRLAVSFMKEPFKVNVGEEMNVVDQQFEFCDDEYDIRLLTLLDILKSMDSRDKVIVFIENIHHAHDISRYLNFKDIPVQFLCTARKQALDDLKTSSRNILITTDVLFPSVDLKGITFFINMWFPQNVEEYVSRANLIGRAGPPDCMLTFFTNVDRHHAAALVKYLGAVNLFEPKLCYVAKKFGAPEGQELEDSDARITSWPQLLHVGLLGCRLFQNLAVVFINFK